MTKEIHNAFIQGSDLTIIRIGAVVSRTGLSRSTVYDLIAKKEFPQRIFLSERAVGWIESEIASWVTNRIQASRNNA